MAVNDLAKILVMFELKDGAGREDWLHINERAAEYVYGRYGTLRDERNVNKMLTDARRFRQRLIEAAV